MVQSEHVNCAAMVSRRVSLVEVRKMTIVRFLPAVEAQVRRLAAYAHGCLRLHVGGIGRVEGR